MNKIKTKENNNYVENALKKVFRCGKIINVIGKIAYKNSME